MLKRALLICLLVLLPSLAFGQADVCINASGGACGTAPTGNAISATGYNPSVSGPLFVAPAASLQSGSQLTLSYDIKSTSLRTSTTSLILDTRNSSSGANGFLSFLDYGENNDFFYMFAANPAGLNNSTGPCRNNAGHTCFREAIVNDGQWHHICNVFGGPTNTFTMVDGVIRDINGGQDASSPALGFTPSTVFWTIGRAGVTNYALRELQSKQTAILQSDCATLYQYHLQGLEPSTGPLAPTTWSISLPMNNCNGSGCADNSGNSNNGIYDSSPPVCSITGTLANGFSGLTGNQTATVSCTDAIGVSSVNWYVDGVWFASSTTAPGFSVTLPTASYDDGSHTIKANALNAGNILGSATSTGTTTNGKTALTYYVNNSIGVDSNNCTATGTPCLTLHGVAVKIAATKLLPGSSILLAAGQTFDIPDMTTASTLYLTGPGCSGTTCDGYAQNVTTSGGHPITISTYGGSGNCHVEAGVTTDCANVTVNANGSVAYQVAVFGDVNVQNVQITNIRLTGSQTNILSCNAGVSQTIGCGIGFKVASAASATMTALTGSQTTITNVETTDFSSGFNLNIGLNGAYASGGDALCGVNVTDSYFHGSSLTSTAGGAGLIQTVFCTTGLAGPSPTSNVSSNVANDFGGQGILNVGDGNGFVWVNQSSNIVDSFNVGGNTGTNENCSDQGGAYPNWWFETSTATVKGNESYNVFAACGGSADNGGFDMDHGTGFFTIEYNYAHNTNGASLNGLNGASGGISATQNQVLYNIFENGFANTGDGTGSVMYVTADNGAINTNTWNNTVWNGFNGQTIAPITAVTHSNNIGFTAFACSAAPSSVANNIMVSNTNSSNSAIATWVYGGYGTGTNCFGAAGYQFKTNDWLAYGSLTADQSWRCINNSFCPGGSNPTTLAAWNTLVGGTDISVATGFSGSPPLVVTCYTIGSGVPTQPGLTPCPSGYQITHGAATENTGTTATWSTNALDYFGNTVPSVGGTNIGADGKNH